MRKSFNRTFVLPPWAWWPGPNPLAHKKHSCCIVLLNDVFALSLLLTLSLPLPLPLPLLLLLLYYDDCCATTTTTNT